MADIAMETAFFCRQLFAGLFLAGGELTLDKLRKGMRNWLLNGILPDQHVNIPGQRWIDKDTGDKGFVGGCFNHICKADAYAFAPQDTAVGHELVGGQLKICGLACLCIRMI